MSAEVVTKAAPVRLDSLTALRFFAALFVVVHHVTRIYDPIPVVSELFELGGVGVSFFFVLSGFVLTWSHRDGQQVRRFYRHRFARVYPLHLLTLVVALSVLLLQGQERDAGVVVLSVLLLQAWVPTAAALAGVNGPSWSLSSEAFFYAVFPLVRGVLARRSVRQLTAIGVGVLVLAAAVALTLRIAIGGDSVNFFLYMDPTYRFWEFVLGIVAALLLRAGRLPAVRVGAAVLAALGAYLLVALVDVAVRERIGLFARIPFQTFPSDLAAIGLAPVFALLIIAAAQSDLAGAASFLRSPVLIRLGTWSFALYLTHLVLISALQPLLPDGRTLITSIAIALGTIVAAIALSAAAYHFVERPLERRIRGGAGAPRHDRADASTRPAAALTGAAAESGGTSERNER